MKRIFTLLLAVLMVFSITACKKDNASKKETTKPKRLEYSESFEWNGEVPISKIKSFGEIGDKKFFITFAGELYEYNNQKVFSTTQKHTKKIDVDKKFLYFKDGGFVTAGNGYIHYMDWNEKLYQYEYFIEGEKFSEDYIAAFTMNQGDLALADVVIDKNNDIYALTTKAEGIETPYLMGSIPGDEDVICVYDPKGTYEPIIKTDKAYYCYAKAKDSTEYKFIKIKEVTEFYNRLLYFDGKWAVYKDEPNVIYR